MADWSELRKWDKHHHERPNMLVRVGSYVALIVAAAFITGVIFWGWNVNRQTKSYTRSTRAHRMERMMNTTKEDITRWFWIGAAVGGIGAVGFIGYYHLRHGETHLDDHEQ